MAENVVNQPQSAISQLKSNTSGNLSVKNGRLYNDGAATYTTLGSDAYGAEAVRGDSSIPLRRVKGGSMTGDLTLSNGNIRVTGYGTVTLVE